MSEPAPSDTSTAHREGPATERPSRGRTTAVVICVVLAGLLTTPAAVAYWGQRTLNDTERYVATVDPLVASPEVQDVIATRVTAAIEKQVDIEAILNDVFAGVITDRPRLERLVGPLAAAINGLIDREVRAFIASDEFADLWLRINTRAQQALHRILTGEGSGAVSVQGNQVVLDVDEVIKVVKERLVARGLTLVENVPIPETDRQIVLLESDELEQLRTIYAFGNPVAKWMLPLVAALYLVAFVLARRRPMMGVVIGALLAANAVLLALFLSVGRQLFVNQLEGTVFGPASRVFYDTLLAYLERGQDVLLGVGVAFVLAGWFAGENRYGTAVRTTVARASRAWVLASVTVRSALPAAGWRPTAGGCGSSPSSSARWSCSGATRSRWNGCGGPWRPSSWGWPPSSSSSAPVAMSVGSGGLRSDRGSGRLTHAVLRSPVLVARRRGSPDAQPQDDEVELSVQANAQAADGTYPVRPCGSVPLVWVEFTRVRGEAVSERPGDC